MRTRALTGPFVGLLTAATGLGLGELGAAFVRPESSPVIAVGNRIITLTPADVKNAAIESAQSNDKPLLISGIVAVVALYGLFVGQWAMRDLRIGLAGVGAFGVVGVYCALTADASQTSDIIPTLMGTAGAAVVLWSLVRLARLAFEKDAIPGPEAPDPAAGAEIAADRRKFLIGSGAAAVLAALAGFGGRVVQHARFSVAGERAKVKLPPPAQPAPEHPKGVDLGKSGVPWATSNRAFYRIDRALTVPQIAPKDWRLRIHGMVDTPLTLTYDDLLQRPLIERWITLSCVSNDVGGRLVGNALFRGALLADILKEAGIDPDADQLLMRGAEGTTIGAPTAAVMDGRNALLAVGMNGEPLPIPHGFPVRVVVPGLYGYVSACKWIVDMKVTTFARDKAFWVENGWNQRTPIVLTSRIDRPHSGSSVSKGEKVAIAGVAWDQHVGVSKVEVQIGDGPWQTARLATVPSTDTWRQWVLPWVPEESGRFRIRVRATDAQGNLQVEPYAPPGPGGAEGWHSITVQVTA